MKQFIINLWDAQKNAEAVENFANSIRGLENHLGYKRNTLALRVVENHRALEKIAAQETPSANATVKRMARIAREALK